jgi:hypothetical protein
VSAGEQADAMDGMDEYALMVQERAVHTYTEALASDFANHFAGIRQVGYTGKNHG